MKKDNIYKMMAILFLLDQWIKWIIQSQLSLGDEVKVIPHFFSLFYTKNTGGAFSIFENQSILFIVFSLVVILYLHQYIKKEKNILKLQGISLGMILGGVFGNLLDRIIHHGVIDYLSFSFGKHHFPIFNFADILITMGVIVGMIDLIIEEKKKKGSKKYETS